MVLGVLLVGLQQVVVDVLHAHLGAGAIEPERLQLLHHQRARRVLGQRLVDVESDFFARRHLAGFQVGLDQLASDVERRHGEVLSDVKNNRHQGIPGYVSAHTSAAAGTIRR